MVNIAQIIDNASAQVSSFGDDLGALLDFGFSSDTSSTVNNTNTFGEVGRVNPEVDLTEVDRANPTNTNFPNPFGLSNTALVVGGLVISLVALKAFKVI